MSQSVIHSVMPPINANSAGHERVAGHHHQGGGEAQR